MQPNNYLIAIYGGSGSGKSTLTAELIKQLGAEQTTHIDADAYYKDLSHLATEARESVNFDHPDSIDHELLITHLKNLRKGLAVEKPAYNFKTHCRELRGINIKPTKFILVEGLLFLLNRHLRDVFDLKIYVDTDEDVRLIRRLKRDTQERGRTMDSVLNQYIATVKPMYQQFILNTRRYADETINFNQFEPQDVKNLARKIKTLRNENSIRQASLVGKVFSTLFLRPLIGIRRIYQQTLGNMLNRYLLLLLIIVHSSLVAVREGSGIYLFSTDWHATLRSYLQSPYFPLIYVGLFFVAIYLIKNGLFSIKQVNPVIRRYVYFELAFYSLLVISLYCFWTFYYGYY